MKMASPKKNNIDELLASSAPITPRKINFHKAKHAESLTSFRSKYKPINGSLGQDESSSPSKSPKAKPSSSELEEATLPVPKKSLYPKDKIYPLLKWSKPSPIGAGLHNVGNTCFLNSTLQCLTYCPPLANYFQSRQHSKACRRVGFCAMCVMERHVVAALKATSGAIVPKEIVSQLRAIVKHFRLGRQEDAQEFLCYLLNSMHKSSLPLGEKLEARIEQTSVVHRIFGGHLMSSVVCAACSYASNTFDPFLDLSLEIKHCNSINDALIHFTKPEVLDSSNMYKCEKCGKRSRAKKQLTIHEAPNVLVIQLKRFSYRSMLGGKISKFIAYPAKLPLKAFMSKNQSDANPSYDLYGVLVHSGYDTRAGHYYCYIKNSNGIWHEMNDSIRRQVSQEQVMKQQAYLLFYVRSPESLPAQHNGNESSESDQEVSTSANTKKRKRSVAAGKHDSAEEDDEEEVTRPAPKAQQNGNNKSPTSGPKGAAARKASTGGADEDLGETVTLKDLVNGHGKKQKKLAKAPSASTPPQAKKQRVAASATSPAAAAAEQAKALNGFAAFSQMKAASANGGTVADKSDEKQPQPQAKPAATATATATSPSPKKSVVTAAANGKSTPGEQPRPRLGVSLQGKAKEAQKDDDGMEQDGGENDDGFDFARMSVDDLFAQFEKNDEGEKKDTNSGKKKKGPQVKQAPAAQASPAKEKKNKSADSKPAVDTATAKPAVGSSQTVEAAPTQSTAVEANGSVEVASTTAAGKKKRRRKRGKTAAAGEGQPNADGTAAAAPVLSASPATSQKPTVLEQNGHVANGDGVSNGHGGAAAATAGQKRKRPDDAKESARAEEKQQQQEEEEKTTTKKHKPTSDEDGGAEKKEKEKEEKEGSVDNGKAKKEEKEKEKKVVGSGKNDKVLSFDDLVFRRGGSGKDLVDSSPMAKGRKPTTGAKEWEQYLKLHTKDNQLGTKTVTTWDGVKGIENKAAKQKHLLQTAPELQEEKRERDQWDVDYDRGRTKKSKKKEVAVSSSKNPFQTLQNFQRERKDAEKNGTPIARRGGRGPMRGRGGRGGGRGRGRGRN